MEIFLRFTVIDMELMGHADVKTTEIDTHAMQKNLAAVASPLDTLRNDDRA